MTIAVLGTGYVGLVSGVGMADFGLKVVGADIDDGRIEQLRSGTAPFFEPGLDELLKRHTASGHLSFTTDIESAVRSAEVTFITVGTASQKDGSADISQVMEAGRVVARNLDGFKLVVVKSTVPVGTTRSLAQLIRKQAGAKADFEVASNPEFLREGSAVQDFLHPDRVIIGTESERGAAILRQIYRPLYLIETPFVFTSIETSELIKYASNSFLAVKVSFINEVANLCDRLGADVHVVARAMGLDKRIGPKFLHPGPGFGGSCFPKDCRALAHLSRERQMEFALVDAAIRVNDQQYERVVEKLRRALGDLKGKTVAVWGLSFKPNTNDIRESRSLLICQALHKAGCRLRLCDPVAVEDARLALSGSNVEYCSSAIEAAKGADAVILATEWNEFRNLDMKAAKEIMAGNTFVDAKNVYDPNEMRRIGFRYFAIGRGETDPLPPDR